MKHKIVTSLEWKCCPGYTGHQCQLTAKQVHPQVHNRQAESSLAASNSVDFDKKDDQASEAVHQKLSDEIYSQDLKITQLKRQVENISTNMSHVHLALNSLEEKINEDNKGNSIQSFLKDLKSKSITELIKEIVKDQLTQMDMQETVAQLYKSMSGISVELEKTKEAVKVLNNTVIASSHKCSFEKEKTPTMDDVLELKTRVEHLKDTAFVCSTSFKEMEEKHNALEKELANEKLRSNFYFESLNSTLSKMKEIHGQLLTDKNAGAQLGSTVHVPVENNITDYLVSMQDKMRKQNIMMLQLYDDINAQDSKINNFSNTLDLQRQSIEQACEDRFSSCKDAFQKVMKGTEENVHVLNKTVSDVVLPLDDTIDKMKEQINDLCYDMEILQPLIEKGAPFSMTNEYEHRNDISEMKMKIEMLTTSLSNLNTKVEELNKGQVKLQNDGESREKVFDRRVTECLTQVEDGLNKTMDIINSAVDSIRDNYELKSQTTFADNESRLNNDTTERLDRVLSVFPTIIQMNETLQSLVNRNINKPGFELFTNPNNADEISFSNSFFNLSKKVNQILSTLDFNQMTVTQIEEKLQRLDKNCSSCGARLQSREYQVSQNNVTTFQRTNKEEEKGQKEIYSRIKALEFKTIRLSTSISPLNKTASEAQSLCQIAFINIKKVNESVPQLIKTAQPNITSLQGGFEELIKSLIEVKTETILSNVTSYIDKTLNNQMKVFNKKTVPPKKPSANSTSSTVGRNQRNTDVAHQVEEFSSCITSPCYNGGTCINEKKSFVCACRHPFGGVNCTIKISDENAHSPDFSKGSYRFAPIVAFFVAHTYGMTTPGPIRFNNLYVNYGSSYTPSTGKFIVPYLGVYIFKYTIESFSPRISGFLVVDGVDKIAFQSENINNNMYSDRIITGDALLELNYGQEVWLRLSAGSIPAQYPPVTTFSGYLLYRT
ncbi:hypothetical protein GDO86_000731 [Hymenochirus boettgeri]|uniref:Multimerin-1 n=1 Tax=Hymenochirus boettgeri TaxID=247094 RepID=A0A8T2KHZ5_9PIPI|nr:hypothetical protein GDO86_000731 [Hymenochirus boettgeri]